MPQVKEAENEKRKDDGVKQTMKKIRCNQAFRWKNQSAGTEHRQIISILLCCILLLMAFVPVYAAQEEEPEVSFYIDTDTSGVSAMSFDNGSRLPVSNVRYPKFQCTDGTANTPACPNLGVGIKYIEGDNLNPDGAGKWRYVYCLEFAKDSPSGGQAMQHSGWSSRKIAYALYYGAVYYGETCRYAPYSTGDWQMDYFVTQMSIHLLNNEFTMSAFLKGLNKSSATQAEKNLVYDRVNKIVNSTANEGNFGGFTPDGWLDLNTGSFTLNGYQDRWQFASGLYTSGGVFHPVFKSYYGYDFCEQLTGYEIQVPSGVSVRKKSNRLYADFDVAIAQNQYRQWALTGTTLPITVKASLPRYWGGGIYLPTAGANYQSVCFLTWSAAGGTSVYQSTVNLHVPKETKSLTVYKKDAKTQEPLAGAVFSLWSYDGTGYRKKVGTFSDRGDGSYLLTEIDYTATKDGWFLIKEEQPPENYQEGYQPENSLDAEDYELYGGREIRMNADGFYSDKVQEPFIFRDEQMIPQGEAEIIKYDIDTGENVEGAGFEAYEWISSENKYSDRPVQILYYDMTRQSYRTKDLLTRTEANEGKFLIKESKVPEGYHCAWSKEIQLIKPGCETFTLEAPNYPGRNFTIRKRILKEEVNWEHGDPTFFYSVWGTDLTGETHEYQCFIQFRKGIQEKEENPYLEAETTIKDIPAGTYYAQETDDISRYILTDAWTDRDNVKVSKENTQVINGIQKIKAEVTADLVGSDGSVTFENRKVLYDEYSDNAVVVNHFLKKTSTEE